MFAHPQMNKYINIDNENTSRLPMFIQPRINLSFSDLIYILPPVP